MEDIVLRLCLGIIAIMIKKLNTVKLFVNENQKAKRIAKVVEKAMKKAGFIFQ